MIVDNFGFRNMVRRILVAALGCLLVGIACWSFWPYPDQMDNVTIDTDLLIVDSLSMDGKQFADWPAEMWAGTVHEVALKGRLRAEKEARAGETVYQRNQMLLKWYSRQGKPGPEVMAAVLNNVQESGVQGNTTLTITGSNLSGKIILGTPKSKRKPTTSDSPEGNASFAGKVKVPAESGVYDLLLQVIPSSANRDVGMLGPTTTRHWRVTVRLQAPQ